MDSITVERARPAYVQYRVPSRLTTPSLILTQPHRAQIPRPNLLNMLHRLNQMRHKLGRVLRRREVAQVRHSLVHRAGDLVRRLLRHVGRVGPVVFAGEHVDGAGVCVDGGDAGAAVPAAEVEVEVAVEDLERRLLAR